MKIFPASKYKIVLNEDYEKYIEILKYNTKESNSLSSQVTDKKFIGKIGENSFRLIGSEKGIGAFTVFTGDFNKKSGTIKTEINGPFKIIISIIFIFPIILFSLNVINNGILKSLGLLVPLFMFWAFIRFVLIGLFNKYSSKVTMDKLKTTLSITSLEKNFA